MSAPVPAAPTAQTPNRRVRIIRPGAPEPDRVIVRAVRQEAAGSKYRLRGRAELETAEALLTADEVDYDEASGMAEARGNVRYKNYSGGEELRCDRAIYDVNEETGHFYEVSGVIPAVIDARPGVLTSDNPFIFEGKWAERSGDRYILHDGFITSCKLPKPGTRKGLFGPGEPWWILKGPTFDVIPGGRAIARNAMFQLKGMPLFFTPFFYKSMEKAPRRSGFLMPNFGNSSRRGWMYGLGYYWAMSRSYDLTYRGQYFTQRGFAHLADFRGKPTQKSDFNFLIYGVNDRGLRQPDGSRIKQGGFSINFIGRTEIPKGWFGYAQINYLSSFQFRQAFTETFNEAVFSEINSTAYLTKHWKGYAINAVFQRTENFQSVNDTDKISIRKLPQVEFLSQDRRIARNIPVWFSFEAAASLMRRNQPLFQTRQAVERLDVAPRVMTALRWKHIHLMPSAAVRGTYWGSSFAPGTLQVSGNGLFRPAFEAGAELILPSLARVYSVRGWLGDKLKHVIEPTVSYRYVTGVADFKQTIRFDEIELLNNTNEIEISIANRLYSKKGGAVREWMTWEVFQRRYFDPDFGGVVSPGQRNVFQSNAQVSSYAFVTGSRNYSPIVSSIRAEPVPGLGLSWRMDYDPARGGVTNSAVTADGRLSNFFLSVGHNQVRTDPILTPPANQFRGLVGFGRENRRGWNAGFFAIYDYRLGAMQFANTQVTYNTDCCGFSIQYRRFNFGTRNENQFRVALAIANIGSFGTLRKQERFF